MKKILLAGLFLLAVPFATMAEMSDVDPSGQETLSCIELKNNMRYRMRDANTKGEVSMLQDFLNSEGFLSSNPTGFFGLSTLKAVKSFQSSVKLSPTGFVGKLTRAQIKELTCGSGVSETTATTAIPRNLTVGCTSTVGYSSVTGEKCDSTTTATKEIAISPTITSLSPTSGPVGKMVVVRGTNFTGNETVYFGGYQVKAEKDYLVYATQTISGGGVTTAPFGGYIFNVPALCPDTNTTCIPVSIANPNVYQVQVVNVNGKSNTVPFTVTTTTTTHSITVLSPNGGETWTKGTTQTIKWQDSNPPSINCPVGSACAAPIQFYDIRLSQYFPPCTGEVCAMVSVASYEIAKNISGSSYSWSVGKSLDGYTYGSGIVTDGHYTIHVCQAGTTTCDLSDSYFKIVSGTATPSITVLSPNGGEQLMIGERILVTVSTQSISGKIYLQLFRGDSYLKDIGSFDNSLLYTGKTAYEWVPDTSVAVGSDYKIKAIKVAPSGSDNHIYDYSDAPFSIATATTVTSVPTVEFIGAPTLNLQYDSAGKESTLVGKATVKVTAAGTPIAFGGSVPVLLSTNGKQAYTNSTKVSVASSVGVSTVSSSSVIPTIPANTTATISIDINVPTKELFAGSYTLLPTDLYYYLNNTSGTNQLVSTLAFKNAQSSNSVTIIGETAPYITSSSLSGASDQTLYVYGDRFSQTGNTVTFGGQSLVIPAAYNEKANPLSIAIVPSKFGIVATGWYTLQISTSEGASNKVNVNVVVSTSVSATLIGGDISNSGTNQSLMKIRLTNNSSSSVIVNTVSFTLSSSNTTVLQDIMVTDSGGANISGTLLKTSFPGDPYNYTAGLRSFEIPANSSKEIHFRAYVESYTPTAGSLTITANWVSLGSDGSQMATGLPIIHKIPSAYGTLQSSSQLASVLDAFSRPSTQTTPAPVSVSAPAWKYSWTRNLEVGSSYADDITALQTALTKEGVYTGEVTGGFYSQTYRAVKAFQAKYDIESTGFVGPITRAKLNELY